MGYRPMITTKIDGKIVELELFKFYGYLYEVSSLTELPSIKYLLDNNLYDEDCSVDNVFGGRLVIWINFSAEQFREWISLYKQDVITYYHECKLDENFPELKRIVESDEEKEVCWS